MSSSLGVRGEDYIVLAKQNCSLTPRQRLLVFIAICALPLVVSVGFVVAGAWMVMPFAGLELLVLGLAFYSVHCHADDYESITITGDNLAVEWREYKTISRVVFQRYWARVVMRDVPGGEKKLWLRSHGKEVECGRYLDNEARQSLARQLKKRIGFVY